MENEFDNVSIQTLLQLEEMVSDYITMNSTISMLISERQILANINDALQEKCS